MAPSIQDQYLLTQLSTASPQRLHLLLIEAALRFARRARDEHAAGHTGEASEALSRAQQIVAELLGGLRKEIAPELVARVAPLYGFVFRQLTEYHLGWDAGKLAAAERVLEEERQTWTEVCAVLGDAAPMAAPTTHAAQPPRTPPAPHVAAPPAVALPEIGGRLCLEA